MSIGFRALQDGVEIMKDGGYLFKNWEWLELSLVTIPANSEAVITAVKSIDQEYLSAIGQKDTAVESDPGVSGTPTKPAAKRGPVKLIKRNPK